MRLKLLAILFALFGFLSQKAIARDFAAKDIMNEIMRFNKSVIETQPEYFNGKIHRMSGGTFEFMRGSAHLMNLDLQKSGELAFLRTSPVGLAAGDLHMHNFSVFAPPGETAGYVIDDLDEACADVPLSYDVFRLAVSIIIGFKEVLQRDELEQALQSLIQGYQDRAASDGAPGVSQALPKLVKDFITDEITTTQKKFIKKKTMALTANRFDYDKHLPVPENEKALVEKAMRDYLNKIVTKKEIPLTATEILDISQRYDKGLSSIGLKRYFVLIRGNGQDWRDNQILEAKVVRNSSLRANSNEEQHADTLEAMSRAHLSPDPFLGYLNVGSDTFLVRQNFPWSETMENTSLTDAKKINELARALGLITADFHSASGKGKEMKVWLEKHLEQFISWAFIYGKQLQADHEALQKFCSQDKFEKQGDL
ncbi:MAG: DUF2252 family protein [Candidatus Riflebacteria bacterium]|nr:DUF2252 family protein [Candidatus Riflebacteria bacterium]